MMKVFHIDSRIGGITSDALVELTSPPSANRISLADRYFTDGCYILVAEIVGDDLDLAYRLTQNIDNSWSRVPTGQINPIEPRVFEARGKFYGRRSSMIGDVIEVWDEAGTLKSRHVVDWFGFADMPVSSDANARFRFVAFLMITGQTLAHAATPHEALHLASRFLPDTDFIEVLDCTDDGQRIWTGGENPSRPVPLDTARGSHRTVFRGPGYAEHKLPPIDLADR